MRALHPGDLHFHGRDHADRTWVVGFTADDGRWPTTPSTARRAARPSCSRTSPTSPAYTLATMEPFAFTSRDGLEVHGYLTFPPGSDRTRIPTVLFVHGGPWARDAWGFSPDPQWLANRGYLCVQVNYRGSTGYGKEFLNAGNREWGARMHDDLLDAVAWARAGQRRSRPDRDLRRLLRRLRRARRRHVLARRVPLRHRRRRPVRPAHADPQHPAVLGAARRPVPQARRQPRDRARLPVVALAALAGRRDPDPDADRPGRERPAREEGGVRADRRGDDRAGDPPPLHGVPRRGARVPQAREQPRVPRRRRGVPGRAPRRPAGAGPRRRREVAT